MNLFEELKRRNVFRVAGVYAVVGWLLAQAAGVFEHALFMPGWFDTIVVSLLLLGFPIALVFAWAFELTPDGVKLTASVPEGESIAPNTGRKLDFVIIGGLALVAMMIVADRLIPGKATIVADRGVSAPAAASIAVLPFADLSPAGDQEYFSDGIAEEILNVLVRVKGLEVASRTSSFQFKGREIGIPEIAGALNVRHVLEGSVRKSGGTIRVTAQLIDTASDRHLWSQTYDRPLTAENVFDIQDGIARAIVAALGDAMGMNTTPDIDVAAPTGDLTAFDLFLRARSKFQSRVDLVEADALLKQAVEQDPNFVKAWEMRGAMHVVIDDYGGTSRSMAENLHSALEFADKALAIDPNSATAIAVRGNVRSQESLYRLKSHDWREILADYDRALQIDPQNTAALNWRGIALASLGDLEAALASFVACRRVDPLYAACNENRIEILASLGRDREAFDVYKEALNKGTAKPIFLPLSLLARLNEETLFKTLANAPYAFFGWRRHDELYQAYREGRADRELARDLVNFAREQGVVTEIDLASFVLSIGAYELTPFGLRIWDASHANYRRSPEFKDYVRAAGFVDYWRRAGFPEMCRPIPAKDDGKDDFVCD